MFNRVVNITNLGGRKRYVKDSKTSEELVGYHQTQGDEFWQLLAKENQEQFKRSLNSMDRMKRASEAREIIVGLPGYVVGDDSAETLAMTVKQKLGVDCIVAIHQKGDNTHAHIIIAERELLQEPIHVEAKIAKRTYYYDENGKKCKKAEAVKTTLKGTILEEAHTRYFTDKKNFYNLKNLEPLIENFASSFNLERFDIEKQFPQKHYGKNNPKEHYIKAYNELVKEMNDYFAKSSEKALKQVFCEKYNIPQRFGVNRTEDVKTCFEDFRTLRERPEREIIDETLSSFEIEKLVSELQETIQIYNTVSADVELLEQGLEDYQSDDYIKQKTGDIKLDKIESKYGEATYELLDELKALASELKQKIEVLKEKLAGVGEKLQELFGNKKLEEIEEQEQDGFDEMIM